MKQIFIILSLVFGILTTINAQDKPHFSKSNVGEKGCTVYTTEANARFSKSLSEDGSAVFTWSQMISDIEYMIIHVDLKTALGTDTASKEDILKAYLDFLKQQFEITKAAGYGLGHTSDRNPKAVGIIDYWEYDSNTKTPTSCFVKGWASPNFITIYIMSSKTNDLNEGYKTFFTNGFQHR
jgi:hypothetical protein